MFDSVKKIVINNKNAPFWSYFWDRAADRVYRSFHTNDESPNRGKFGSELERIVVQRIEPLAYSFVEKRVLHIDAEQYRYNYEEDELEIYDETDSDYWDDEEKLDYVKVKSHSDDYRISDRPTGDKSGYQYMKGFNRTVTSDLKFENAYSVNIESGRSHYYFVMDKQTAQSLASAILQVTTDEYADGQPSRTISDIVRIPEAYKDQEELGLGFSCVRVEEYEYEITEVIPGRGGDKGGLIQGMTINKINDIDVNKLSHLEATSMFAGRGKDEIKLSVRSPEGGPSVTLTIPRLDDKEPE